MQPNSKLDPTYNNECLKSTCNTHGKSVECNQPRHASGAEGVLDGGVEVTLAQGREERGEGRDGAARATSSVLQRNQKHASETRPHLRTRSLETYDRSLPPLSDGRESGREIGEGVEQDGGNEEHDAHGQSLQRKSAIIFAIPASARAAKQFSAKGCKNAKNVSTCRSPDGELVEDGGVGVAPVADEVGDGELLGRGRGGVIPEEEVQEQPHQLGEHVLFF